MMVKYFLKFR